jgi:peptide deformylase
MSLFLREVVLGGGYLAVPGYTFKVERVKSINLKALDQRCKNLELQVLGYEARAVQNEIDHLDEKLFLGRLLNLRNSSVKRVEIPQSP